MRYLSIITTLLFSLSLIACSTNTEPELPEEEEEIEYPFRVGAWEVMSEDRAKYVGTNEKNRSLSEAEHDTVIIDSPENQRVRMYDTPKFERVNFEVHDSTIQNKGHELDVLESDITLPNDKVLDDSGFRSITLQDGLKLGHGLEVDCDANADGVDEEEILTIRGYNEETEETYVIFEVKVKGIAEVAKHLRCGTEL